MRRLWAAGSPVLATILEQKTRQTPVVTNSSVSRCVATSEQSPGSQKLSPQLPIRLA